MRLLPILFLLSSVARAEWQASYFHGAGFWSPTNAQSEVALAQCDFRYYRNGLLYMLGGLATTNVPLGDLRNTTLKVRVRLETSGNPNFVYGGQNTPSNPGPMPAHCRLFLTSDPRPFAVQSGNISPSNYWWSADGWISLSQLATMQYADIVTSTANLWTHAHGLSSFTATNGFEQCVSRVAQVMVMIGGGSFYDVGGAIWPWSGSATLYVVSFEIIENVAPSTEEPSPQ